MRTEHLHMLADVTRRLLAHDPEDGGLQAVVDTALRIIGGNHASVRLCAGSLELRVAARAGEGCSAPAQDFRIGQGLLGWVAAHGKLANISDSATDPRFAPAPGQDFAVRSVLSAPLSNGERTLGVLSVSAPTAAAYADRDEALVALLAQVTSQALVTAEMRRLAVTDSQTLAYNRGHLVPRLRHEMQRAQRAGTPLSVMLVDLDHFKRVNDEHGHVVGDAVLRCFADRVRDSVRSVDVLVRRGGEEFVLILPDADLAHAGRVAERLREDLERNPLRVFAGLRLQQTASIGVACWDRQESAEALDERADHAMYAAKSSGRNRVVCDGPGRVERRRSYIGELGAPALEAPLVVVPDPRVPR